MGRDHRLRLRFLSNLQVSPNVNTAGYIIGHVQQCESNRSCGEARQNEVDGSVVYFDV